MYNTIMFIMMFVTCYLMVNTVIDGFKNKNYLQAVIMGFLSIPFFIGLQAL